MTNQQMVDKYLASVKMRLVEGGGTLEPILPFFMTDVAYNMWQKDITPIPCRHELKRLKREWVIRYGLFNRRFFSAFTPDEQDEVIDKMDSFDSYIANHVMVAKIQIMNFLSDIDTEKANQCSSLMIVNILCQAAQIVWRKVYKDSRNHDSINPEIVSLEKISSKFMNKYHDKFSDRIVNPNNSKMIVRAVDILCDKIIRWLTVDIECGDEVTTEVAIKCDN